MAVVLGLACGARYKTRPGLTYHLSHSHNKPPPPDDELELPIPSPRPPAASAADGQSFSMCVHVLMSSCSSLCRRRCARDVVWFVPRSVLPVVPNVHTS